MPADLDLLDEVYSFAKDRAVERTQKHGMDLEARRIATSNLRMLQTYYAEAKHAGTDAAFAAAIDVFRKAAMRDSGHSDFDPRWTLPNC